jgi:hypothetical protein
MQNLGWQRLATKECKFVPPLAADTSESLDKEPHWWVKNRALCGGAGPVYFFISVLIILEYSSFMCVTLSVNDLARIIIAKKNMNFAVVILVCICSWWCFHCFFCGKWYTPSGKSYVRFVLYIHKASFTTFAVLTEKLCCLLAAPSKEPD